MKSTMHTAAWRDISEKESLLSKSDLCFLFFTKMNPRSQPIAHCYC